ncbi:hypothetical protein HDU92_006016 [Lobulomyces angularis]|nr:hypothetical protein HDU92_006016 [Lobulomyces angularis]
MDDDSKEDIKLLRQRKQKKPLKISESTKDDNTNEDSIINENIKEGKELHKILSKVDKKVPIKMNSLVLFKFVFFSLLVLVGPLATYYVVYNTSEYSNGS